MKRHALLIGIDEYPLLRLTQPDGRVFSQDLRGCVNDVDRFGMLLCERFGFADSDLTILRNGEATRDAILTALASLLQSIETDDLLVLFFAGHGSQMVDREGTKPSGWDETFIPADSGRGPHPNRDITDDELRLFLLRAAEKTRYTTLIFDCCHSGTLHRELLGGRTRGVPRDERPASQLPASPLSPSDLQLLRAHDVVDWLPARDRYVALAACGEREKAAEVPVPGEQGPIHHGALTHFLVQQILQAPAAATYRDVFECAAFAVTRNQRDQHPLAEGALHRQLFGTTDHPPSTYALVTRVYQGTVTLAAGEPEGVQPGSLWALFPPGSCDFSSPRAPCIRITDVAPGKAVGCLLDTDVLIDPYSRAVLIKAAPEHQWPIAVPPESGPSLLEPIQQSPWLRVAEPGEQPCAELRLGIPPSGAPGSAQQLEDERQPLWSVLAPDGVPLLAPLPATPPAELIRRLECLCRKSYTAGLSRDPSSLTGVVQVRLLRLIDGAWTAVASSAEQPAYLPVGTRLVVEISNSGASDLHIALLQIDEDPRRVCVQLYPPVGRTEPLGANHTIRLGDGEGDVIRLQLPEELPPERDGSPRTSAEQLYKLFVLTQPGDLRRHVFGSPEEALMRRRARPLPIETQQELPGDRDLATSADWTATEIRLQVCAG